MVTKDKTQPQSLDTYKAYLVRMWQDGEQNTWRASAQAVQGGEVVRFPNLQALFAFLEAQTQEISDSKADKID
ncbi:MAG: hypothetical protein KDI02_00520 [Anaerolineae bacterium]|nr:hypothetical protein [Anaerolineae bacterium]MCB0222149.1 hypothetical protein [Anaerolineae bacterium]MCB9108726.1 hypothetical protein [Anaerolineales bacterium]